MIDRLVALKTWKAFPACIVVMLILHTQCSVNTIDSMSIWLKNVGVKSLSLCFIKLC